MKTPEWLSDWVNYSMSEWKTINLRTEDFLPKINYEGWILPVSRNFSGTSEDMEWRHRNQKLVSHRLKALGIPFPKSERTTLYFYQIVVHYPMRKREIEICNLISLRHFFTSSVVIQSETCSDKYWFNIRFQAAILYKYQ